MPHPTLQSKRPPSFPGNHPWALGVFAKEPCPGLVKTRLTPPLSPEAAAYVYECSLGETVSNMAAAPWDCVLFYSGAESYFRQNFPGLPCAPQSPGDLGTRLDHALATLLAAGYQAAALIGSDSPDLPREMITNAFLSLSAASAVTIPARDGGYVLIGEGQHYPVLFRDIPWSSSNVMAVTRNRAEQSGVVLHEIGLWEDFDDAMSLKRLLARSPHSATARLVLRDYVHLLDRETTLPDRAISVAGEDRPTD